MSYSNMKPMEERYHQMLVDWVKNGGALIYCGEDIDPYQQVPEWWNKSPYAYHSPSEHLFELAGLDRKPAAGNIRWVKENTGYTPRSEILCVGTGW